MCKFSSFSSFIDFYLIVRRKIFFNFFRHRDDVEILYSKFELGFKDSLFSEFLYYFHLYFCKKYFSCVDKFNFKFCKGDYMLDMYKDFLRKVEGLRLKVYKDIRGVLTIGYGRNLESKGISLTEAEIMLNRDVNDAISDLIDIFPNFYSFPENLRIVLVSMMVNLGKDGFLTFKRFINAVKKGDKKAMVYELLNSKRAKELPNRVNEERHLLMIM